MRGKKPALHLRRLGIDTYDEAILYLRHDCPLNPSFPPSDIFYYDISILKSGNALVTNPVGKSWIVDLKQQKIIPGESLKFPRTDYNSVILKTGDLLLIGGRTETLPMPKVKDVAVYVNSSDQIEKYDEISNKFSEAGHMLYKREGQTTTLLESGEILITGGMSVGDNFNVNAFAELYNPSTQKSSSLGKMLNKRMVHNALLIPSKCVLISGGRESSFDDELLSLFFPNVLNSIEEYPLPPAVQH